MAKILILHGPNLNLLGQREPEIYGSTTLAEIDQNLHQLAAELNHKIICWQTNAEHELINAIQAAPEQQIHLIIINPAAFSHTSIALRDTLTAVAIPCIEVHLSNTLARESFRHHSYISSIAMGIIQGFGTESYQLALRAAHHYLGKKSCVTQHDECSSVKKE